MGLLVYDSFTRTSTTTLGVSDTSQTWTAVVGTWGTIGNQAYSVTDTQNDIAILPSLGTGDYTVSCNVTGVINSGNYRETQILVRYIDSNNFIKVYFEGGTIALSAQDSGLLTTSSVTLTDGNAYNLKVVCLGSQISIYIDGVQKINYTLTGAVATKYATSGVVGVRLSKSGTPAIAARWDDFRVFSPDVLAYDSFTRADSTTTLGSSEMGQAWTAATGTWGIRSNKAYSATDTHGDIVWVDAGTTNFILSGDETGRYNVTDFRYTSLMAHYVDGSNFMVFRLDSNKVEICKMDSDSLIVLASTSLTTNNGQTYNVKVNANNGVYNFYIDGVFQTTYTLNSGERTKYLASSKVGLRLTKAGAPAINADMDNFIVTTNATSGTSYPVNLSDSLTMAETFSKKKSVVIIDTVAMSDSEYDAASKNLSDSVTVSDSMSQMKGKAVNLSDSLVITDTIRKAIAQLKSDSVALADADSEAVIKAFNDSLTLSDSISTMKGKAVLLSDSLTVTDSIKKIVGKLQTDNLSLTDSLSKRINVTAKLFDVVLLSDSAQIFLPNIPSIVHVVELEGGIKAVIELKGEVVISVQRPPISLEGDATPRKPAELRGEV